MKLLLINSVCGIGSTGRICTDIATEYEQNGYEVKIAYGRIGNVPDNYQKYAVRIGSDIDMYLHVLGTRLTDRHGLFSTRATKRFIKWADEYDPDILWLHNIHGYYINYKLLFDWIRSRPDMQIKWTLHDCWTFTGHCPHYMYAGCEKWKRGPQNGSHPNDAKCDRNDPGGFEGCHDCPLTKEYPGSLFADNSRNNYLLKKKLFCGVNNLTIITPSKWLAKEVKKGFLSEYPVEVSYNRIDTRIFAPGSSDFRTKNNIPDKAKMILAAAGTWTVKKGLDDLKKLSYMLPEKIPDATIAVAGLTSKQIAGIKAENTDILCIERIDDCRELAELYRAADVFINPTYEDNYPTVNLEAEACGTPVITYNTGGCAETVKNPESRVIPQGVEHLIEALIDFYNVRS